MFRLHKQTGFTLLAAHRIPWITQAIELPDFGCNSLKEGIASWKIKIHTVFRHQQEHKGGGSPWELWDWLAAIPF